MRKASRKSQALALKKYKAKNTRLIPSGILIMDINAIPINHGISSEHWIEFIREHGLCIYDSTSGDKPEFSEPSKIEVKDINQFEIKFPKV